MMRLITQSYAIKLNLLMNVLSSALLYSNGYFKQRLNKKKNFFLPVNRLQKEKIAKYGIPAPRLIKKKPGNVELLVTDSLTPNQQTLGDFKLCVKGIHLFLEVGVKVKESTILTSRCEFFPHHDEALVIMLFFLFYYYVKFFYKSRSFFAIIF